MAQQREQADLILEESERLARVFEDILEMARIDAGAVATDFRWAHPSEIVSAARDQVARALQRHALDVAIKEDTPVRLDPRLTASALAHVIENAAQYAPPNSTITITTTVNDDGLTISVRDRGPGIAPSDLPRLFERFFRGTTAKSHTSGNGMGLSIARGLLAAEEGRIWGENHAGGGAEFTLVRPRRGQSAGMTRTPRILLVDDEIAIQRAVGPLLQTHGYDVEMASAGQAALKLAAEHAPDLIVLDLGLPDLDGTEVCRRIRETSRVPIIVLSARGGEADKVRALDLGADDFVTKPFGPEELLARIRVALRRVMSDAGPRAGSPAGRRPDH